MSRYSILFSVITTAWLVKQETQIDLERGIACMTSTEPVRYILGKGDPNNGDFVMYEVPKY